jgi:hypothetical protein
MYRTGHSEMLNETSKIINVAEVFSGDQPCENGVNIQRSGDSLCLHYEE